MDVDYVEPGKPAGDTQMMEVGGRERPRSSRDNSVGESQGSYASVVRGFSGSNYKRSDWKEDKQTSKMDWGDKKSNWSSRGWNKRDDGHRK